MEHVMYLRKSLRRLYQFLMSTKNYKHAKKYYDIWYDPICIMILNPWFNILMISIKILKILSKEMNIKY